MDVSSILISQGVTSDEELQAARQKFPDRRADQALVEAGTATEDSILQAFAKSLGMNYVELKDVPSDREILAQFPAREIFRYTILPLHRRNGKVVVATHDPFDLDPIDELSSVSGLRLEPVLARREDISRHIKERLGLGGDTINELMARRTDNEVELLQDEDEQQGELSELAQEASVVRLVNELIIEALQQHASDVHLEPQEQGLTIRYRIDGILQLQPVPQEINQFQAAIISRLKIMAHLNIAEKRLPQDGRIKIRVQGREIDVRVSIIPMLYGEGVVLRLLDKSRMKFNIANVGLAPSVLEQFDRLITMPHGMFLVTGPTGSGKTSTLYCALNAIKGPDIKIITVEDPVEYQTEGIQQIQVHSKIGLTFAAGLRSILRHDPDAILIGEIRDGETAESAIQASLTGHMVFSTLHTNDSAGAFTRLVDMGIEPYLVASTVEGVLAQRLVRVLCPQCKVPYVPIQEEMPDDFPQPYPEVLYKPNGCRQCRGNGFVGRMGIFELLVTDSGVRQLCIERASATDVKEHAIKNGLVTLRQDGWKKVAEGLTSVDEVARVTKGDQI